ncbi:GDP-fucose protein O-fucosyltransferase 2 isoform X1 [Sipha flava]|uniref:GDP-fucose protein O-fucosyltransferase 2 n=2 Tax=Sipha flava TaxID=143950 RepID=A0A8B8FSF2_9HEMI|nr:GDP-fucose protein O-fucosyltransferase 2 isoform X1 [Sipha flava]XP_025413692.1 GDP-fucose protein O-fucosyltransferase 2 isoform X1 [Sipha flava]
MKTMGHRTCSWNALVFFTTFLLFRCSMCSDLKNHLSDEGESFVSHSVFDTLPRFVLYDVNKPEGFNLRRDVFIRMASFIHYLNKKSKYQWILVLPPWHRLYHWRSTNIMQDHLPWSLFFNVESIKKTTPVVELHEFFQINKLRSLDAHVTLQHFNSFEENPEYFDKWEITNCKGHVQSEFWNLKNLTYTLSLCISFQGSSTLLAEIIEELQPRTIIFDHAELALHNFYSGKEYWAIRKSMQFSNNLHEVAKGFKKKYLKQDYMCAHLRRRDFVYGHPNNVPSIKETATQIKDKLNLLNNIDTVYIATDSSKEEFLELCEYLQDYKVFKFIADEETLNRYLDGGIAIIDQIICSQAIYFIGTSHSTFSFRIQEEREILGFPVETTFNCFCGDNNKECTQPTKWRLVE